MSGISNALDRLGNVDTGSYMSGGLVSKALDLLGTTQYAAAGATDALLNQQNPLEGAVEGIRSRKSFMNVLADRGAPRWVSTPVGLLADLAVPIAPGAGLITHLAGAVRSAEFMRAMGTDARTIEEGVKAARASAPLTTEAVDAVGLARDEAARGIYVRNAENPAAPFLARRAAAQVGVNPQAERMGREALAKTAAIGPQANSINGNSRLIDAVIRAGNNVFAENGNVIKDMPEMMGVGRHLVEQGTDQLAIRQTLSGMLQGRFKNILDPLRLKSKADHEAFTAFLQGWGEARSHLWEGAKQQLRDTMDEVFAAQNARGVRQKNDVATVLFKQMSPERQEMVAKAVADVNDPVHAVLDADQTGLVRYMQKFGATIDGTGTVVQPITKLQNYIPLVRTEAALKKAAEGVPFKSLSEMSDAIRQIHPGISGVEAQQLAKKILSDRVLAPNDIKAGFQHQRMPAEQVADHLDDYEMNSHRVLMRYADDAARSISEAEVWGGDLGTQRLLRNRLALNHGIAPVVGAEAAVKQTNRAARESLDRFDHLTRILGGNGAHGLSPAYSVLNKVTNTLFLGPRTMMLQWLNLPNSSAISGIQNSIIGAYKAMLDPVAQGLVRESGAIQMNMVHALDDANALEHVYRWNPIMSGVEKSDAAVRAGAAYAGGVHMADLAKQFREARGDAKALKRIGVELQPYGRDLEYLAAHGGQFSKDDLFEGMRRAANITNFTSDALKLPYAFNTPAGQFFLKFRQFSAQQGHFIKDILWNQAYKKNNYQPLLRYAAMFPWVYGNVFKLTNDLKAKKVDREDSFAVLQNMLLVGAFGFFGDMASALGSGNSALAVGAVAGANTSTAYRLLHAPIAAAKGNWGEVKSDLLPAFISQPINLLSQDQTE